MTGRALRLLVVGASGGTGRELVTQALAGGHEVTAFLRPASRRPDPHPRLRIVLGDVMVPDALRDAVAGQDAVVCALGHKRWFFPTRILSRGTEHLVAAMRGAGVTRLVVETALGIGDAWWQMGLQYTLFVRPVILPFYFHDKVRQEAVVRGSGLDWTIVRPGALTNGPALGRFRTGARVGHWLWTVRIARADVAAFMLAEAVAPRFSRQTVGLAY